MPSRTQNLTGMKAMKAMKAGKAGGKGGGKAKAAAATVPNTDEARASAAAAAAADKQAKADARAVLVEQKKRAAEERAADQAAKRQRTSAEGAGQEAENEEDKQTVNYEGEEAGTASAVKRERDGGVDETPAAKKQKTAAEPAIDFKTYTVSKACAICKNNFEFKVGQFRCKECNAATNRISRLLNNDSTEDELCVDWELMDEKSKRDIVVHAHCAMGSDLVKLMKEKITQSRITTEIRSFKGTGDYMDLEDITDKYKNKPLRLQAILRNTKTIWCKVGECTLYEDVNYERSVEEKDEKTEEKKREMIADRKLKKTQVVREKAPKKTKAITNGEVSDKPLSAAALIKYAKDCEKLDEIRKKLSSQLEEACGQELVHLIPAYVVNSGNAAVAKIREVYAMVELAMESRMGVSKEINAAISEAKLIGNGAKDSVNTQLSFASGHIASLRAAGA
jgi:hypothetical protein